MLLALSPMVASPWIHVGDASSGRHLIARRKSNDGLIRKLVKNFSRCGRLSQMIFVYGSIDTWMACIEAMIDD